MGLFSRKNPFSDLKFDNTPFRKRRDETIQANNTIYDASIGEAANRSAMAGSISGVANQGRLSADTFAKITEARNNKNASIIAGYNQQEAQAETAFNRERDYKSAEWEASQPTFLDYLTSASSLALGGLSIFNALKTGKDVASGIIGGANAGLSAINSKIQGGRNTNNNLSFTPTPITTPTNTTFTPITVNTSTNTEQIVKDVLNTKVNFGSKGLTLPDYRIKSLNQPFSGVDLNYNPFKKKGGLYGR